MSFLWKIYFLKSSNFLGLKSWISRFKWKWVKHLSLPKSWELSKQDTSMEFLETKVIFSEYFKNYRPKCDNWLSLRFYTWFYIKLWPMPFELLKHISTMIISCLNLVYCRSIVMFRKFLYFTLMYVYQKNWQIFLQGV